MLRLVLDTSTIVSAFFWNGNEAELFRLIEKKKLLLFITKDILDELYEVVSRPKFKAVMQRAGITSEQIIEKLLSISSLEVQQNINIDACRDRKDNKFLECAVISNADYIVSGDDDLLSIKEYNNIKIVSTKKILDII